MNEAERLTQHMIGRATVRSRADRAEKATNEAVQMLGTLIVNRASEPEIRSQREFCLRLFGQQLDIIAEAAEVERLAVEPKDGK